MTRYVKENRLFQTFVSWDSLDDLSSEATSVNELFKPVPVDEAVIFRSLRPDAYRDDGLIRYSHQS